jgi:K+-dependent Na+/Ca+ exchanger-like protein
MTALLSLLAMAVAVYLLAIITDEYFIISLDEISRQMKLPSDVAGASLMAMGSSAPELAIALIAVFSVGGQHSDVGMGTIVGSAVFNILVITGASAIVAQKLEITTSGVERDIIFYLGSVSILLFVFWDGTILRWEAGLMVVAYISYLALLWYWSQRQPDPALAPTEKKPAAERPHAGGLLHTVNHGISTVFGLIARNPEKQYVWAMIVSIGAIAALSYALVEATIIFSAAVGFPPVIVSLTLLAAGTSAPDLIASINVANEGRGDMAVANAVGSNIFDVLVGLGVPWLLVMIIRPEIVHVGRDGLLPSVFILSGTVVLLYIFLNTERKLTRLEGWGLILAYVLYVIYAILTN